MLAACAPFVSIVALGLFAAAAQAQTLRITSGTDSFGDSSVLTHVSERVVAEAFRRAGYQLVIEPLPRVRAIEEADDGEMDGAMHRIFDATLRYHNLVPVPTPIGAVVVAIYGRSPEILTQSREQIAHMKIATLRGVLVLEKFSRGMNAVEASSYSSLFEMLNSGRVDVLMTPYVSTEGELAARRDPRKLVVWPHPWASEPLYLMLNRRHEDLIPRIDAALLEMKKAGLIDRYYEEGIRALKLQPLR
jgi:polar amino acid transport system substrate-binding protein